MQAPTFRSIVAQRQQDNRRFLRILQGILVGALLGAATARQLITNAGALGGTEIDFIVPWTRSLCCSPSPWPHP